MMCPVDGPTEGRHEKTRRKTRQEEGRDTGLKNKNSSPMSRWLAKDDTRDQKEGRDQGLKTMIIKQNKFQT